MFKSSEILFSALSKRTKRVRIQLLKDFPKFQLHRGQLTRVKPSLMTNYLHAFNGAKYVLQDSDIDLALLAESEKKQQQTQNATVEPVIKTSKMEQKQTVAEASEDIPHKKLLDKDITLQDVKIPGLDI